MGPNGLGSATLKLLFSVLFTTRANGGSKWSVPCFSSSRTLSESSLLWSVLPVVPVGGERLTLEGNGVSSR